MADRARDQPLSRRAIERENRLATMVGGQQIGSEFVGTYVTSPIDLQPHDCGVMVAVGEPHVCPGVDLQAERGRSADVFAADDATGWPV